MAAIVFDATTDHAGARLHLGGMGAIAAVFGLYTVRGDPGLRHARLQPPLRKGQSFADRRC